MVSYTIEEIERMVETQSQEKKQDETKVLTDEEKKIGLQERDTKRKIWITDFYFEITGKVMTDEDYKKYLEIYDNSETRRGWNIKNFIEGDIGSVFEKDDKLSEGS